MGNGATNIGNARDDADEVCITVDRRGVILDWPDVADVMSLRLARGQTEAVGVPPPSTSSVRAFPPVVSPQPTPLPFWMRWPFRATTPKQGG